MPPDDPIIKLLSTLVDAGIEFILVGGAAAVLRNVEIVTKDVDIVHRRDPENIERLMGVLQKLDAHFWPDLARRKLPPRASDLAGHGHILLRTTLGRLDVLCELSGNRGYEELLPHSGEIEDFGIRLRVLDLAMLIQVKAEANRDKDRQVLPLLIAALEEAKKRKP
jgi:hypothetical protein